MEFIPGGTLDCYDVLASASTTCSESSGNVLLTLLCKTGCSAGQSFKIQVKTGLKNVDYVLSQTQLVSDKKYFKMYTRLQDNSFVDGVDTLLITPILFTGTVTLQKLTRSSNVVFDKTSITLQVTSQSIVYANNVLAMQLPTNFLQDDQALTD